MERWGEGEEVQSSRPVLSLTRTAHSSGSRGFPGQRVARLMEQTDGNCCSKGTGDPSSLLGGFQRQKCQDISCEGPRLGQSCHRHHLPKSPGAWDKLWWGADSSSTSVSPLGTAAPRVVGVGEALGQPETSPGHGARA